MTKARLVKRQELMERERIGQAAKPPSTSSLITVNAVKEWMQDRRPTLPLNPRATFAALFAPPQAS